MRGKYMRRYTTVGDRDWSKRPLFSARRRRRYVRWLLLLVVLLATAFYIHPDLVTMLLGPFFT